MATYCTKHYQLQTEEDKKGAIIINDIEFDGYTKDGQMINPRHPKECEVE